MLEAVRLWILLSTLLVSAGWILSALHQLNRPAYTAVLALAGIGLIFWLKKNGWPHAGFFPRARLKFQRRFKRPAPLLFLILALLSFLAGSLYPALNYDANQYRLPRVFHWLWFEQWHWIRAYDSRMNISACGFEWLSAPLILFTRGDRLLFLINWVSYLMLPGLIFSVFTRLQIRPIVAWWWMWLLSSGWCFALQAGSAANDSFAAVYILAAVDLALRAREKNCVTDLWLSMLAAGLVTGVKQTDIPLALLWLIAAWPSIHLLWARPIRTAAVIGFSLLVSIVPISVLNYEHTGSWLPLNNIGITTLGKFSLNPFWGIIGNAICIPVQNLLPPFYNLLPPFYSYWVPGWNELMRDFLQTPFGAHFTSFENFGFISGVFYNGMSEGNAGIGLGICVLMLTAIFEARRYGKSAPDVAVVPRERIPLLLRLAPWGLLLLFMAKVGTFENARHLAPYYVFLFPIFLIRPGHTEVVRQRQWRNLGLAVMVLTVVMLSTLSERPLFPAKTIWSALYSKFPGNEFVSDEYSRYLKSCYQLIQSKRDYLKQTLQALPSNGTVIGYDAEIMGVDEPGIWLPYGNGVPNAAA